MAETVLNRKFRFSNFDEREKKIYLQDENDDDNIISITCKITLTGVRIDLPISNYQVKFLVNPYLNAQNDIFKVSETHIDKTIGYIIPLASLIEDEPDEEVDKFRQAYKFYTLRYILNEVLIDSNLDPLKVYSLFDLFPSDTICLTIYTRAIEEISNFSFENYLPSLAIHGYYNFTGKTAKIISYIEEDRTAIYDIIDEKYLIYRGQESIRIKSSNLIIEQSPIIKILYQKILLEGNNPLYRFLTLYQVIEYLIEGLLTENMEVLIQDKANYNPYEFFDKLIELKKERNRINKLVNEVSFDGKENLAAIFRAYLISYNPKYKDSSLGDCFYDIRNLFVHNFKAIIQDKRDEELKGIVLHTELLIHQIVIRTNEKLILKAKEDEIKLDEAKLITLTRDDL